VYDPEIPVNIYDLGLIYVVHIDEHSVVNVQMTLTAPACPVAGTLPGQVENVLRQVEGVRDASVELVWDPPWDQERMSEEARLTLGML
jgi:FeS assembly SUF system protein